MAEVKKTRVRRPKERPLFYKTESTGALTHITTEEYAGTEGGAINNQLVICPYTKYVPIIYLSTLATHFNSHGYQSLEQNVSIINNIPRSSLNYSSIKDPLLGLIQRGLMENSIDNYRLNIARKKAVFKNIEDFLKKDNTIGIVHNRFCSYKSDLIETFKLARISRSNLRTYSCYSGFLSSILAANRDIPQIMAVIPREEYIYQRMRMLTESSIDLSRVIILVNRELDLPGESGGIPNAYKALYQKDLEPIIKGTNARIWKVPQSFIEENCFVNSFKIQSRNREERKEEIRTFLEAFYNKEVPAGPRIAAVDPYRVTPVNPITQYTAFTLVQSTVGNAMSTVTGPF